MDNLKMEINFHLSNCKKSQSNYLIENLKAKMRILLILEKNVGLLLKTM